MNITLEKLHRFDSESIKALDKSQNDLDIMQTYINELGGMVSCAILKKGKVYDSFKRLINRG
ncbi:hypothetical protein KFZ58_16115 [Virgibacillus sp. NKC19-16]|nr:hypothetical protein KFZ58_16115 [Virgibacillus sp. NKC19-16]